LINKRRYFQVAVEQTNDSYNRCLDELRARYKGRGISNSIKNEAAMIAKKEANARAVASESYVLFDSRSNIADSYRSGEYNGSKYMTSDDFVRYFKTRRAFYMPEVLRLKQEEEAAINSTAPVRKNGARSRELMGSESGSKEGHLKTIISALEKIKNKWFPMEAGRTFSERQRFKMPVAIMSGMAVFTLSLGLIVGGSVMIGNASGDLGRINSEIAVLEAKEADLEGKLDLKYDINQIEADAKDLGMIKREHADNRYVSIEGGKDVIVYDNADEGEAPYAALLAAFGVALD
jgi:hypothetical protein